MKQLILKIIYKRLASVARAVINKHRPVIIAITGSVGKTSTKEALVEIMRDKFGDQVRFTKGNLNAEIGIPLTILGYGELPPKRSWLMFLFKISKHLNEKSYPKYLILEMGVERPGDIDYFCGIVKPTYAVITAATPAHLANFSSLDEMKSEKLRLADHVLREKLFYNCDDEYLAENIVGGCPYGIYNSKRIISASEIEVSVKGNSYNLSVGNNKVRITNELVGEQMIYADIAAAGVANTLGIAPEDIAKSLNRRKSYNGRMKVLSGKNNMVIIDDTYNANPASVVAAAETLHNIKYNGRKILVLGNMNELGPESENIHVETAKNISDLSGIDCIYFVGPNSQKMFEAVKKDNRVKIYKNRQELERDLNKNFLSGDLILVKASQNNNYFEELVKLMLSEGVNFKDVLVRQSKEWLLKK